MILVLNGASSSGKTTLARAIQERWDRPLLHLGTDTMISMLPRAYVGREPRTGGIEFLAEADACGPVVRVRRGELAREVEDGFALALRRLADADHDLVLDLVLDDPVSLRSYVHAFRGLRAYLIGVRCELDVLEARERERGDRHRGLARGHHAIVHEYAAFYDLAVDTTASQADALAASIVAYVHANRTPSSFARLAEELGANPPDLLPSDP